MARVVRGAGLVPAERVESLRDAAAIREAAHADAERIISQANAERVRIETEAREQGLVHARAEACALLVAAAQERERLLGSLQRDVVSLALDVARKVIGAELESRPETVARIWEGALARLRAASSIVLRVHPEDLAAIEATKTGLESVIAPQGPVRVVADEAVGRGGCVVESDLGRVDSRIEVQLAAIERALLGEDG